MIDLLIKRALFDLETDGLLDEVTVVHLLVIKDLDTEQNHVFCKDWQGPRKNPARPIADGVAILAAADLVVGHNITSYDCPVLKKLYGVDIPWHKQRDTMILSRLVWPELKRNDLDFRKKVRGKDFPGQLIGRVSLEAWGHRLGCHKGEYAGDPLLLKSLVEEHGMDPEEARKVTYSKRWSEWNQAMEDYGIQDVEVCHKLWLKILSKDPSEQSVLIETQVAAIISRQERYGFLFNEEKAVALYAKLVSRKLELEDEVLKVFKPRFLPAGEFTPGRDSKQWGYCAGASLTKVVLTTFNPSSRDHVAGWLKAYYGWKPTEFTNDGKAKVDDEVISKLPYAEAAPLKEYFMVVKRLGQIAEGKEAWLKAVKKDGRIHGTVNTNGAATGRMTHARPNMGQVPAGRSPYGHECRELFCVPTNKKLVGADASALELCDLAGYMARYDDGEYVRTVLEGDKSLGTDMHSVNARALGLDPKAIYFDGESGRDIAKTWFYAFIYGAGDEKLGYITTRKKGPSAVTKGKADRAAFLRNLPAMGLLVESVKDKAKTQGFLLGLDKRKLYVRSQHAALNTLLQSAGAVQMKKALCLLDDSLQAAGFVSGIHYEFVANVHDEWQIEVNHDIAEIVGRMAVQAITDAGIFFGFRCPLDGAFEVGDNWAETH